MLFRRWWLAAAFVILIATVAIVFWLDADKESANPRQPGTEAALRREIHERGAILVRDQHPYWLLLAYPADRRIGNGELVALYPYIDGYHCLLRPRPPTGRPFPYVEVRDGRRCTNGSYNLNDLRKYPIRISQHGTVFVDTTRLQPIQTHG